MLSHSNPCQSLKTRFTRFAPIPRFSFQRWAPPQPVKLCSHYRVPTAHDLCVQALPAGTSGARTAHRFSPVLDLSRSKSPINSEDQKRRLPDQQRLRPVPFFSLSSIDSALLLFRPGIHHWRSSRLVSLGCCICAFPRRAARVAGPVVEKRKPHLRPLSPSPPYGPQGADGSQGSLGLAAGALRCRA